MFKFLKDKFKKAVDGFSKKAEEEVSKPSEEEIAQATKKEAAESRHSQKSRSPKVERKTPAKTSSEDLKSVEETKSSEKPVKKPEVTEEKKPEEVQEPSKEHKKEPIQELEITQEAPKTTAKKQTAKVVEKPQGHPKKSKEDLEQETEASQEPELSPRKKQEMSKEDSSEGEKAKEKPVKGKGLFSSLKESFTKVQLTEEKFEDLFWDLEMSLLENNVAVEVIEKIKNDLKKTLTEGKVTRKGLSELIEESLRGSIEELFEEPFDLLEKTSEKKPYVIAFVGVNGSGKTTTLAKIANMFQESGKSVVMAAADTFRAAAIDQLQSHANTLGIKLISQGYGADPAAVAYDAIEHAKAKDLDVVMIDTAGRLHSNNNLMAELEKVIRVAKPDLKIFIGESITGNDCVEQAEQFNERVGIDAIILSKADIDEKGGAAISVSYVTKKPILYLGTGQSYGDLEAFDKERILRTIGLL